MEVTINGERHGLDGPVSVQGLLRELGHNAQKIAVEHNLEIVPRSTYKDIVVKDGDRLEIVHFVGGG